MRSLYGLLAITMLAIFFMANCQSEEDAKKIRESIIQKANKEAKQKIEEAKKEAKAIVEKAKEESKQRDNETEKNDENVTASNDKSNGKEKEGTANEKTENVKNEVVKKQVASNKGVHQPKPTVVQSVQYQDDDMRTSKYRRRYQLTPINQCVEVWMEIIGEKPDFEWVVYGGNKCDSPKKLGKVIMITYAKNVTSHQGEVIRTEGAIFQPKDRKVLFRMQKLTPGKPGGFQWRVMEPSVAKSIVTGK